MFLLIGPKIAQTALRRTLTARAARALAGGQHGGVARKRVRAAGGGCGQSAAAASFTTRARTRAFARSRSSGGGNRLRQLTPNVARVHLKEMSS